MHQVQEWPATQTLQHMQVATRGNTGITGRVKIFRLLWKEADDFVACCWIMDFCCIYVVWLLVQRYNDMNSYHDEYMISGIRN